MFSGNAQSRLVFSHMRVAFSTKLSCSSEESNKVLGDPYFSSNLLSLDLRWEIAAPALFHFFFNLSFGNSWKANKNFLPNVTIHQWRKSWTLFPSFPSLPFSLSPTFWSPECVSTWTSYSLDMPYDKKNVQIIPGIVLKYC